MVKLNFFKATKLKGDSYIYQFSYTGSYLYFLSIFNKILHIGILCILKLIEKISPHLI